MNRQIAVLFRISAVGIAVLITMTAYWQIWAAPSLAVRQDNARLVYRQLEIKRGLIYAANGSTILATNHPVKRDGQTIYLRRYPLGPLFAHAVGYNTIGQGRTGTELYYNDYLTASNADLSTVLGSISDQLQGQTVTGNNVVTSLSVPAQRAAVTGLQGKVGAVVALNPTTGQILAMASTPGFNPNTVGADFGKLATTAGAPLLNRGTQGLYPPGSTFKVVTTAAALNTGQYTPATVINGHGSCITVFTLLCNAGGESAGDVSLSTALTYSYNTVFAQVGQKLGKAVLYDYMQRFGFFQPPPLDYPSNEMATSGLYQRGNLLSPSAPVDVARLAIGQERLLSTPLQMAEVAATIANKGVRMRPTIVDRVVSPSGHAVLTNHPEAIERVVKPVVAAEMTLMMRKVVEEGTGQTANLGSLPVAGKTGTAEIGVGNLNDAWFIAFAPATAPKIAIAVVVEHTPEFGATAAAPIAKSVIEAYLPSGVAK